ncbi:YgfZ/GcvT domain-containing protein [Dyella tabacisoli]|uniref:Folate-binding protein n=1 Tax=Dyella tabacisoli TaxID=2282381 RepID=A0A369US15_9GAMM|nr:folate-binding protein YgfZ [Dyella tabacisoli]RDD81119.1 folate-binding protein [Dyella tabacisoli]
MTTHHSAQTLSIEGADAVAFAHAQFSSDVTALAVGQWQFSAWLDAQGRVRALFHLARLADDSLLLLLRGGVAADMADALRRFVFRSKVTLRALEPRTLGTGPVLAMHTVLHDEATLTLGCDTHSLIVGAANDNHWRLAQLRAGWPWLPAEVLNELLPPALSLLRLHAVALDKGCYPGQEIVARLHYRGGNKRHLHCVVLSQEALAGTALRRDEREIARLLDVVKIDDSFEALAVIADESVNAQSSKNFQITSDGMHLQLRESWPA